MTAATECDNRQMRHFLKNVAGVIATVMLAASGAWGSDLTAYRWKNRLLLVFASSHTDPGYAQFDRRLSEAQAEVQDRDLVVFRIFEKEPSHVQLLQPKQPNQPKQQLSPEEAETLRRRFDIEPGRFTVVLIGKDGGVKMVREHRADLEEFFARIDSMPMRQQEMRDKGKLR